ncbi:MAG: hypothetical protein U0T77_08435 [Chitinophagales bacterium]
MHSITSLFKSVLIGLLLIIQLSANAQLLQGRRPTEFPDLPQLTDSTLLFTQDSITHESYKFKVDRLREFLFSGGICLDSSFRNLNSQCIFPSMQTKSGGNVFYGNMFNQLVGDTSGQFYFCNAISSFSSFSSHVQYIDSSVFIFDTSFQSCNSNFDNDSKGYEYSQSFPTNIQLCPGDIIDKIVVRVHFNQFYSYNGGAALTLSVNGILSNPSNRDDFDNNSPDKMKLVGSYGNGYYSSNEFVDDADRTSVSNVTATFLWTDNIAFQIDGMEVEYYIKKTQIVLTTDSNGCVVLDTINIPEPEPFNLNAGNGLTVSNSNIVKLGGELSENTHVSGNQYEIALNNLSGFYVNTNQYMNLDAANMHLNASNSINIQSQEQVNISSANNSINITNAYGNNAQGINMSTMGPISITNAIGNNTQGINLNSTGDITIANNYGNQGYLKINPGKDNGYPPAYFLAKDTAGNSNWRDLSTLGAVGSAVYTQNGLSGNGTIITPVKMGGMLNENTIIDQNGYDFGFKSGQVGLGVLQNIDSSGIGAVIGKVEGDTVSGGLFKNDISMIVHKKKNINNNGWTNGLFVSKQGVALVNNNNQLSNSITMYNNKLAFNGLLKDSTAQQVLAKDASGYAVWRDVSTIGSIDSTITVNGISGNGTAANPVKLGGLLTENTTIDGNNQIFTITKNKRFYINQSNVTNSQIDQFSIRMAKSNIFSEVDNDTTNGLQIIGKANGSVINTIGVSLYGENNGNATLSGGTSIAGRHTGSGINTIGTKILGENVKGFGVWIEGKTQDATNSYSDIYIRPVNGKMIINNLNTDNAAPQVLAKDANGFSVWRDASSLNSVNGILNINNTNAAVTVDNKFYYVTSTATYTLTLSTVGIPVGTVVHILNYGTKSLTLSPGYKNSSSATLITSLVNTAGSNTLQLLWNGTNWLKL